MPAQVPAMLKTRVLTALALAVGLLLAVFALPQPAWLALCALLCGLASWEWGGLSAQRGWGRALITVLLPACFGLIVLVLGSDEAVWRESPLLLPFHGLSAVFWLGLVPWWLRRKWVIRQWPVALLCGFVVLLPTTLALAQLRAFDPWLLLAVMAVVWVADIAAYFSGRRFGRNKLAPSISPGKTREGAFGAVLAVLLFGFGLALATGLPLPAGGGGLLLSALVLVLWTVLSIVGDLFESLLKRQVGIKDSSQLLPGHGGILDRIDSLTSTLPLAALVWLLWLA